jgi:GNAT superfamily N-acetyltransferase
MPQDLEVVQRLNHDLFRYESGNGFYLDDSYCLEWPFSDSGRKYFQDRLSESAKSIVLVAEIEGELVGYLAAGYQDYSYRAQNPIAELENMFIVESHRRQGIGTLLADALRVWAEAADVARLRVGAFAGNASAIGFYRRFGFVDDEVILEMRLESSKRP